MFHDFQPLALVLLLLEVLLPEENRRVRRKFLLIFDLADWVTSTIWRSADQQIPLLVNGDVIHRWYLQAELVSAAAVGQQRQLGDYYGNVITNFQ